MGTGVLSPGG